MYVLDHPDVQPHVLAPTLHMYHKFISYYAMAHMSHNFIPQHVMAYMPHNYIS
jgi:hypothetical protein